MSGFPVAVLGASGLIGQEVARHLADEGFAVMPVARRFTPAQKAVLGERIAECPIVTMDEGALQLLLGTSLVVVNCLGVLQDDAERVHRQFVERLLRAMPEDCLLIHLSIPGEASRDGTQYSRSKREAESLIAASGKAHVILRPGFVVAPAAFGGSALVRALAALPIGLARREAEVPFAAIGVSDLAATVTWLVRRRRAGIRQFASSWDVMERAPSNMGEVVALFRKRFGGPEPWIVFPSWLLDLAAAGGDLAARLGWRPPVCRTSVTELRRGVAGDPGPWIAATGIEPAPLETVLARLPATVQEGWFARLFLLKPLILLALVLFWIASGVIALTAGFDAAVALVTAHDVPPVLARVFIVASSLLDIGVGLLIARRATCRTGLITGIVVALGYMAGCALLMPELWGEPLGALVKTGPAIVLMLVALAMLEDRR